MRSRLRKLFKIGCKWRRAVRLSFSAPKHQ